MSLEFSEAAGIVCSCALCFSSRFWLPSSKPFYFAPFTGCRDPASEVAQPPVFDAGEPERFYLPAHLLDVARPQLSDASVAVEGVQLPLHSQVLFVRAGACLEALASGMAGDEASEVQVRLVASSWESAVAASALVQSCSLAMCLCMANSGLFATRCDHLGVRPYLGIPSHAAQEPMDRLRSKNICACRRACSTHLAAAAAGMRRMMWRPSFACSTPHSLPSSPSWQPWDPSCPRC